MDARERLIQSLARCPLGAREIAREMTRRGIKTTHPKVNRWAAGQMPKLNEAALLAEVADIDLLWLLYGEGPAPWELTDEHRRLLWLADIVGFDEAANRLAAADPDAGASGSFSAPRPPTAPRNRSRKGPA